MNPQRIPDGNEYGSREERSITGSWHRYSAGMNSSAAKRSPPSWTRNLLAISLIRKILSSLFKKMEMILSLPAF